MSTTEVLKDTATVRYVLDSRLGTTVLSRYEQAKSSESPVVQSVLSTASYAASYFAWGVNKVQPSTISDVDKRISALATGSAEKLSALGTFVADPVTPVFDLIDSALDSTLPEDTEELIEHAQVPAQPEPAEVSAVASAPLSARAVRSASKAASLTSRASLRAYNWNVAQLKSLQSAVVSRSIAAKDALLSKDTLAALSTLLLHCHDSLATHKMMQRLLASTQAWTPEKVVAVISDADTAVVEVLKKTAEAADEESKEEQLGQEKEGSDDHECEHDVDEEIKLDDSLFIPAQEEEEGDQVNATLDDSLE